MGLIEKLRGYYYFATIYEVLLLFSEGDLNRYDDVAFMRKLVLFLLVLAQCGVFAQSKQLTLEAIWGGEFRTEGLADLRSMNDGEHYTILNKNRQTNEVTVDKYEYRSQEKVATLVSSSEIPIEGFSSYSFSDDESKLLLATELERVYRWSRLGMYYVYDMSAK